MNAGVPLVEAEPYITRTIIDRDIEVQVDRSSGADTDCSLIFVWSGAAPLIKVMAAHQLVFLRNRLFRRQAEVDTIMVAVCYAGRVIASFRIPRKEGFCHFKFSHSGGHPEPVAFSVQYSVSTQEPDDNLFIRALIKHKFRAETEIEMQAAKLFPEFAGPPNPLPGVTELHDLGRSLSQ